MSEIVETKKPDIVKASATVFSFSFMQGLLFVSHCCCIHSPDQTMLSKYCLFSFPRTQRRTTGQNPACFSDILGRTSPSPKHTQPFFFNNLLHLPVGAAVHYLPFFQPGVEHGPQAPSIFPSFCY